MTFLKQLKDRCGKHEDSLNRRISLCEGLEEAEKKVGSNAEAKERAVRRVEQLRQQVHLLSSAIDTVWSRLVGDLMNAYFSVYLPRIRNSHVKDRETALAKEWGYGDQKTAVQECIGDIWGNPDSFFAVIYNRCPAPLPGEGMVDEVYGTVFIRTRNPLADDLAPNNIHQRPIPERNSEGRLTYVNELIDMLNQPRICRNIDQGCYSGLFNSGYYVRANDDRSDSKEDNSEDDLKHKEMLPFHANERELLIVQNHTQLLVHGDIFHLVYLKDDIPPTIHVLLLETKLRQLSIPYQQLIITGESDIRSGAVHRQENDPSGNLYGLDIKPDFRVSIVLDALLREEEDKVKRRSQDVFEREVCFMQSEIKRSIVCDDDLRAKLFFQMADAISRQEALLYGYKPASEIDSAEYAPFCVGTFVHGSKIDFYLGVSAHPDENRRGFDIYKYKTVNTSPTNDGVIESTRYFEAIVAFCNQIDLSLRALKAVNR
ncbi:hypothetical protein THASP1DRAFT_33345 [Thamnocephalis sphaerospora]|uniref:Uncharacterized protein n=1 Tax=Thamnocephalis sphaerospora TaxID=78915 RepID=A0A4P9XGR9_9FUNG|nr:hypothetical protein THASP1DRAFT_33345 [Thamnocephalis sphaerospora]|eukprot:RKP04844.1 hypothetical protein THASP1DRAFT_33345 [Thamnocephalis sphaerospora]